MKNKLSNDSKWQGKGADSYIHSKRMGRGTGARDKLLEAVKSGITKRRELLKQVRVHTGVQELRCTFRYLKSFKILR